MENLRIYASTFNVGTNSPSNDLNALLDCPSLTNKQMPDFYILGFQEVKSQPQNMLMDTVFTEPWTDAITKILRKSNYVRVKSIRLQGIMLLVYCLKVHLIHLRDIETQFVRTGFGGVWGNKGAVSVRLSIYGCSICIVNSHLTAHDHQLEDRISDYNTIVKNNLFRTKDTTNIFFHDYVFWMGDLNFRLTEKAPESPQTIVEQIKRAEKDDYTELLNNDQLRSVIASGVAFSELKEAPLRFPPTYKFGLGSDEYDTKRRPAWTDRILHRVNVDNYENITLNAVQLSYNCLPQFKVSDHKPVIAEFNIKIRQIQKMLIDFGKKGSGYSMADSVPEERPVFSNYTERCVEFLPIKDVWYIGDADLPIRFSLSRDVEINSDDWIGIFESEFENLDDYISYEYVGKVNTFIPSSDDSVRIIPFSFPVGSGVRNPGFYRFLYFSQPNSDVRSLLGISEPFEVRSRDDDNPTLSVPPANVQIPTISGNVQPQPSSSQEAAGFSSIIRHLSNLNVQNDLSID